MMVGKNKRAGGLARDGRASVTVGGDEVDGGGDAALVDGNFRDVRENGSRVKSAVGQFSCRCGWAMLTLLPDWA